MKISLPILTSLFLGLLLSLDELIAQQPEDVRPGSMAVSVGSPASSANSPIQGDVLLLQAIERLNQHHSIVAKTRQEVSLFGHILLGSGEYFQYGPPEARKLRLSLRMQLGNKSSSLLQVCDGSYLWIFKEVEKKTELQRIDLKRVSSARAHGMTAVLPGLSMHQLTPGGLPRLLASLATNFRFDTVRAAKLHEQPVYLLQGRWEPGRLAEILPEYKEEVLSKNLATLNKLPEHFPRSVVVLLGTEDLFPYRIEFHRGDLSKSTDESGQAPSTAIVTMQWFEVLVNGAVNPQEFVYEAGDRAFTDATDEYMRSLGTNQ